jgi:cell division protein FtsB
MVHGSLLVGCLGVFLVVCKLYLDQYAEIRRLEERREARLAELNAAREGLEHLEREVAFLGTLGGVEKLAREKLKYINRDEVIVLPVQTVPSTQP